MSESKKRKKAYYTQSNNKRQCFRLDAGMKGFLITCNNNEKRAVQEGYSILNEYADMMYGPEQKLADLDGDHSGDDDNFESAIRKELQEIHSQKKSTTKRFQVVDTKTNNCVFIKTTLEQPDELVSKFLSDVYDTHVTKSRFILKLFPVLGTCRATVDKIEKLAELVLEPFMKNLDDGKLTYCTIYKVRNNNLSRDDILPLIGRVALQLNPSIKVNFDEPDLVVSVDVLQKFCCVSVMTKFFKFRKYNVQEIAKLESASISESKVGQSGRSDDVKVEDSVSLPVAQEVVEGWVGSVVVQTVLEGPKQECPISESQDIIEETSQSMDQSEPHDGVKVDESVGFPVVRAVVDDRQCLISAKTQDTTEGKLFSAGLVLNHKNVLVPDLLQDVDQTLKSIDTEKSSE